MWKEKFAHLNCNANETILSILNLFFLKTPYVIRTHNALVFLPIFVLKPKLFLCYISTKSEIQNQQTYLVNFKISPLDALLDQLWARNIFVKFHWANRVARKRLLIVRKKHMHYFLKFCLEFFHPPTEYLVIFIIRYKYKS